LKLEIEKAFRQIASRQIHLTVPQEMKRGLPVAAEAQAARTLAQDLTGGMKDQGFAEFGSVRVDKVVGLSLRGEAFAVEPQQQGLPADAGLRWTWSVTPRKSGAQVLVLAARVQVEIPISGTLSVEYLVKEKAIIVKGSLRDAIVDFVRRIIG
jgi:hypothetical protein